MFRNYLLSAIRNLAKNKVYVVINALGLGIALACCITAYLLVAYNVEFDDFHKDEKVSNIFKIHSVLKRADGRIDIMNGAPIMMAPTIANDLSGIKKFTRYLGEGGYTRFGDNAFQEYVFFADSTFFEMFDFPMVHGSAQSFKDRSTIIISQKLAKKYFDDQDPLGKVIQIIFANDTKVQVVVGAVVNRIPQNSSFEFDAMIRIEHFYDIYDIHSDTWTDWRDPSTFLELNSPELSTELPRFFDKYVELRNKEKDDAQLESFYLEPFKSTMGNGDIWWTQTNLRIEPGVIMIFAGMAAIILLIACFNLTNTTLAITASRIKEVGIRKVVGAGKSNIVAQFFLETMLLIFVSLVAGFAISRYLVPAFRNMWDFGYGLEDLNGMNLIIALVVLVFFASLIAGVYPAISNSSFQPVSLLKGKVRLRGTSLLTRILVSAQFALSVIVLIAGITFIQNSKYQEQIDLGYDLKGIITVYTPDAPDIMAFKNRIADNPLFKKVALTREHIGQAFYRHAVKVDTNEFQIMMIAVGQDYLSTMGLDFIQGREFNMGNPADVAQGAIVNKTFLERAGLDDPINHTVTAHKDRKIIGVVSDHYHNLGMSKDPEPYLFYPAEDQHLQRTVVRVDPADLTKANEYLKTTWDELFPDKPYEGRSQEEVIYAGARHTNRNLRDIFLFLTVLAVILSGTGILSLASLNVKKRTKEIGIRKTLGATVANIQVLINREFLIILAVAAIGGSLAGFYLTNLIMDQIYALHLVPQLLVVIASAFLITGIGILTTGFIVFKVARANPVEALRYE